MDPRPKSEAGPAGRLEVALAVALLLALGAHAWRWRIAAPLPREELVEVLAEAARRGADPEAVSRARGNPPGALPRAAWILGGPELDREVAARLGGGERGP